MRKYEKVTKDKLLEALADRGLSKQQCEFCIEAFIEVLQESILNCETIVIPKTCTITIVEKKARTQEMFGELKYFEPTITPKIKLSRSLIQAYREQKKLDYRKGLIDLNKK